MERSSQVLQHRDPKFYIFFKKFQNLQNLILSIPREKNRPRFVNISPTLVIDTTMGMSL